MEPTGLKKIQHLIPKEVRIVAATKYVNSDDMKKLYALGIYDFGENRVDAFLSKYSDLKDLPIVWHFIGHLQKNKALLVLDKIDYLHSLDSIELARIIEKRRKTPLKCFIEVNINHEESKHGIEVSTLNSFVQDLLDLKQIELIGLMGMSKAASSPNEKLQQFKALAYLRDRINHDFGLNLTELSMGMSDDFQEAITAGSTMVRLGRILWTQEN